MTDSSPYRHATPPPVAQDEARVPRDNRGLNASKTFLSGVAFFVVCVGCIVLAIVGAFHVDGIGPMRTPIRTSPAPAPPDARMT